MRGGRGVQITAGLIAVGAVALEVALFLRWQNSLFVRGKGADAWTAATLPSVLLALLGLAGAALAVVLVRGRRPVVWFAPAIAVLSAGAIVYCALARASTQRIGVYILRGYSAGPPFFTVRRHHCAGEIVALIAAALLLAGAVALLAQRARAPRESGGPLTP